MVEKCYRCQVSENAVKLYDAIYEGEMSRLCERCSIIENVPIIKKPTSDQLKQAEKSRPQVSKIQDEKFIPKQKLMELNKNPKLENPVNESLDLIEHFDWEIMKARRRKGLSQKQLAEALVESETAIQMLEKGQLVGNAETIITKLDQFFLIRLRKPSYYEKNMKIRPVLRDVYGRPLDKIPEPVIQQPKEEDLEEDQNKPQKEKSKGFFAPLLDVLGLKKENNQEKEIQAENPKQEIEDFDIQKSDPSKITIADLNKMHRKRLEVSKQERIEEQKKIEERQKLIEAKKEELRLKKEKESKDIDAFLGGKELLKKD